MSLLKTLTTDDSIAKETDNLGSGGVVESGLYASKVAIAYIQKAASEALGLVLHLKTDAGREIRQTLWMTSGKAKGGTNTYTDKDGKKHYLPGFLIAESLALLTVGKSIAELDTEERVIKAWSKDAGAEVPTKVEMVTALLDQEILAGIIKQTVDKTKLNESTKQYEPTGEKREENEIDKFFRASDRKTTTEIRAGSDAAFADAWSEKNAGKTRDRSSKGGAAGANGVAGAPKTATGTAKPTSSLFNQ